MAKARLRGRRKNIDSTSVEGFAAQQRMQIVATDHTKGHLADNASEPEPEPELEPEPEQAAIPEPEQGSEPIQKPLTAQAAFKAALSGEDRLANMLGLHVRRAFETDSRSRPQPSDEASVAGERDSAPGRDQQDGASRPAPKKPRRPLSARLRASVADRTGTRIQSVSGTLDTASIKSLARRSAKSRLDREAAAATVKRLTGQLAETQRQKQQQAETIQNLHLRVQHLRSNPERSSSQDNVVSTTSRDSAAAARR